MQKIEFTDYGKLEIHCPFCGKAVINSNGLSECEHTLYQASDGGFEFISEKLTDIDGEIDMSEMSIDEYTDKIKYPNSVKIAIYQPAPSFFGGYVAFSNE